MSKINDLNLKNWKEYQDLLTDSLWIISERDKSGSHKGDYPTITEILFLKSQIN